ncbi:MAG: methylcrotonoyl-CoA carboxylase [Robiginitomaculum sp.]|nr:MAG: methylcrotonoyl-CoA carboxylase [Robiginitomaculum sp.]
MFTSLLIANRGEIACRIMRTARHLGMRTIAVYSEADADALHVREADEAVLIGPAEAAKSYLSVDAIMAAAQQTGAEAIHPGYGFLSENQELAAACERAGIIFVGPSVQSMRLMGMKDEAKRIMQAAGVPVTPGYHGEDQREDTLAMEADKIGYPVLIKAVAGGGGRGMRRVDAAKDFLDALKSARREAKSAFGDDRVLIEKFILNPRHIEVQIFGDRRGRIAHFYERDCSVQRRHQKVIEESPAPGMSAEVRIAMCAAAVEAARAVAYENAGTVEFIVDGSGPLRPDGFWFMEMNTRLQVEHPVSELVTGFDLVALQLRVAAGGSVPEQDQIAQRGHAIEVRLYAEDPANGYMPSTGRLDQFELPQGGHIRLDSGFAKGDLVSEHYDPMLGKIITHAPTRDLAIRQLGRAVASVHSWPVRTNAGFLARVLNEPDFQAGEVDTGFIAVHDDLLHGVHQSTPYRAAITALVMQVLAMGEGQGTSPWQAQDGWRLNQPSHLVRSFGDTGEILRVRLTPLGAGHWKMVCGTCTLDVHNVRRSDKGIIFMLDGVEHWAEIRPDGAGWITFDNGDAWRLEAPNPDAASDEGAASSMIAAPMPGKVLSVAAKAGQSVTKGETLVVLEAMKMEHSLDAPKDGVIAEVSVSTGDQVNDGDVLVRFEDD